MPLLPPTVSQVRSRPSRPDREPFRASQRWRAAPRLRASRTSATLMIACLSEMASSDMLYAREIKSYCPSVSVLLGRPAAPHPTPPQRASAGNGPGPLERAIYRGREGRPDVCRVDAPPVIRPSVESPLSRPTVQAPRPHTSAWYHPAKQAVLRALGWLFAPPTRLACEWPTP